MEIFLCSIAYDENEFLYRLGIWAGDLEMGIIFALWEYKLMIFSGKRACSCICCSFLSGLALHPTHFYLI